LDHVFRLAYAANGKELLSSEGGKIWVRESATCRVLRKISDFGGVFSADAAVVATISGPSLELQVLDVATGKQLLHLPKARASQPLLSANGKQMVFATFMDMAFMDMATPRITYWDLVANQNNQYLAPGENPDFHAKLLALSPDGVMLAVARTRGVYLADARTGKELVKLPPQEHADFCAAFSPGGKLLALGNWDNNTRLYDTATGKELAIFRGHQGHVYALAFSPDGERLASASSDTSVLVWDLRKWTKAEK
jgi:WD40 repeat protein